MDEEHRLLQIIRDVQSDSKVEPKDRVLIRANPIRLDEERRCRTRRTPRRAT